MLIPIHCPTWHACRYSDNDDFPPLPQILYAVPCRGRRRKIQQKQREGSHLEHPWTGNRRKIQSENSMPRRQQPVGLAGHDVSFMPRLPPSPPFFLNLPEICAYVLPFPPLPPFRGPPTVFFITQYLPNLSAQLARAGTSPPFLQ